MKRSKHKREYIDLTHSGKKIKCSVHRLVAIAFIENQENKPQVNHIDGNPLNNNSWNLEWVTDAENKTHASINGLLKRSDESKEKSRNSALLRKKGKRNEENDSLC